MTRPGPLPVAKRDLKFGLPGAREDRRRALRAAIEKQAETLRRLAR